MLICDCFGLADADPEACERGRIADSKVKDPQISAAHVNYKQNLSRISMPRTERYPFSPEDAAVHVAKMAARFVQRWSNTMQLTTKHRRRRTRFVTKKIGAASA